MTTSIEPMKVRLHPGHYDVERSGGSYRGCQNLTTLVKLPGFQRLKLPQYYFDCVHRVNRSNYFSRNRLSLLAPM
jgi:hypothetical protein